MYRRDKIAHAGIHSTPRSGSTGEREQEEYWEKLVEENCGNLFAVRSVATV
jgi:hypothetical protein